MLLNLHKKSWKDGLKLEDFKTHESSNEKTMKDILDLAKSYSKSIEVSKIDYFKYIVYSYCFSTGKGFGIH